MKSADPDAIDVNAVSVKSNDQGIAPNLPGLVKVFENAPEAEGLFSSYFGINLSNLAGMSPEELGAQTDMILQAKQFAEYIPIIEQHINDYIKAVTDYNTFIARSIKAGCKGIKEIDKAKLDVLLEWMGYKAHTEQLGRKSDNEKTKIENETENYIRLSDFNLDMALKMRATAVSNSIAIAEQRPLLAAEQAQQRQLVSDRKQRVKELIQYGTRGK
ncbi:hypothetical protein PQG02_32150 (plasmid) [Nostoc sp. UHCC 0926]|uniref:hypothetical protein n=1 Tax=Nostoc sp. UHCC 0926 TaxID=3025190 RepID=UPI002363088F|nr:hypothetical protein [Nostoc sp. UHCC 0926]WDD36054.1 hypothetical protein PQG02_32150 [Nostoc sp. UHCC 0926]